MRISPLHPEQVRLGCRKKDVAKSARLVLLVLALLFAVHASIAQIPLVTVDPATNIISTAAAITGTVNPEGQPAGCFVQWGATTAYGFASPVVPVPAASTALAVSNNMIGLSPNTTYHYRLAATNSSGTGYSPDMTLTTTNTSGPAGQPPTAVTQPATAITTTSANLWGTVGSVGVVGGYFFRWGLDTNYGNTSPSGFIAINEQIKVSQSLGGLSPGTTYHFQIVATNSAGTTFGADQELSTQGFFTNGVHVFTYFATNGTITITAYSGPGGEVPIPNTIAGLPVTVLGSGTFAGASLTNLTLPDSLISISENAFNGCSGLTKVVIPNSVTNVGDTAFYGCSSLTDLTIGNHVLYLGRQVFCSCQQLTRVVIPDSVTRIEDGYIDFGVPIGLFGVCSSLTNATVGSGLAYLGEGAFAFCPNLTSVYFRGNTPALSGSYDERMFYNADSVIVYYLAGTTGWGPTFCGRPTMLWNAIVPSAGGGFGMQQGHFGFNITGTPNIPLVVEAATAPTGPWVPVQSCTLTNGSFYFSDPGDVDGYPARFYRVRWP